MNPRQLLGLVLLAAVAGAAAYVFVGKPEPTTTTVDSTPPAATAPDPATTGDSPEAQLAATIPQFQLADQDGVMRSLRDDFQGKALIVNFWATWCAPCRREIPLLMQLAKEHAGENFQVVGIAVDFRDKVLAYSKEMKISYPMLIGEQDALDAAAAFGVQALGLPFTIFTDTGGRVITLHMGELTAAEADIILDAVRDVNAGRTDPAQARVAIESGLAALPPADHAQVAPGA
jgi:thiol-disulfide isomerase/thioredoxin